MPAEASAARLNAAALAFDAAAPQFDRRFRPWQSVQAQRRVIRRALAEAFPAGSRIIEIGGGTGEDALWMAERGCDVLLTDASSAMVATASVKCGDRVRTEVAAAEDFEQFAGQLSREPPFDGAYSVFAALNCVTDLRPFAEGIARLLRPGAPLLLVTFGTCCPGEMVVECLRGRPSNALRRFRRGEVPAQLGGREFTVRYHRRRDLERAFGSSFRLASRQGVGVFVPPSAAEPWISRHPLLLAALESADTILGRPLGGLGDHVLYRFVRTGT